MKKILTWSYALVGLSLQAQPDTIGLDAETKSRIIWLNISDKTSSTTYVMTDGSTQGGGSSRVIKVGFKQGDNGEFQELDRNGDNLYELIKNDRKALTQFEIAYDCRRKAILYNVAEITFEVGAVGLVGLGLFKKNQAKANGVDNKGVVIGCFVGAGASLAAFYFCWYKAHSMLTKYSKSIERCVSVYNNNLIEAAQ